MCDYTLIAKLIPWDLLGENAKTCLPTEMKVHLTPIIKRLKSFIGNNM